ncbi:MAG: HNH endonuclease signature motif containing protein [Candidatus Dormibacteria bacterium]
MRSGEAGVGQASSSIHGRQFAGLDAALTRRAQQLDDETILLSGLTVLGCGPADVEPLRRYLARSRQLRTRADYLASRALALLESVAAGQSVRWLKDELKMGGGEASEHVILAQSLDAIPSTAELFASGEITGEQAGIVAESLTRVIAADASRVEARLLGLTSMNAGAMRLAAREVVAESDGGADLHRNGERAWKRRSLHIGPDRNGSSSVSGYLTSEAAVHWAAALEPWMRPAGKDDDRTADQRRHDAALQVMKGVGVGDASGERSAAAPGNGRRPQVVIMVPIARLLGEAGPPAMLQGRIPIPLSEVDRYLCEADLTVAFQNAAGNIVYQGNAARSFSRAQRRGLIAIQKGCAWPGCDRAVELCDGHHLDEFGKGGKTTSDRGALTCNYHHDKIHSGGWALVPDPGGGLRAVPLGDPDNPRTGLTPEEYVRRRARAILQRRPRKRRPSGQETGQLARPPGRV